ncbi:Hypothetical protein, putative [Bodo saltans]|uniref:Uncharacterized protein n=1 Tax=Bodo saltans TaxID=75058 RepID=A0A0S4J7N9_BODSA|nr:Hypothetical protein, putative [Bodo saltans]|eukprot:CUG85966.1 Hypothetical protein, putative [Bodo saltans]
MPCNQADDHTESTPLHRSRTIPSTCARTYTYWRLQKLCRELETSGTKITIKHIPGTINPADPGSGEIHKTTEEWNDILHDAQQHTMDTENGNTGGTKHTQ